MSTLTYRTPELPWTNNKQGELFRNILLAFLVLTLVLGVLVPNITLPEIKREKLEKVPPQLAKVIKRKKEKPKPKPVVKAKVQEKKIEKKIEPIKKEAIKNKPKPKPKVIAKAKPKPKPKPKKVLKKKHTPEQRKVAKAKAKKMIASFADDLADMQSMVDMSSLAVDSSVLNNAGMAATEVGSVIDQAAVNRVSGVDETQLTRATGAEQLAVASRNVTEVKSLPKEALASAKVEAPVAGMSRTQMQIRRVFEQNKARFDRIYRKALRSNPALEGTITLGVTVAESGEVSSCKVKSSDLQDNKVEKRIALTCKMLAFDPAASKDIFEYPLAFGLN